MLCVKANEITVPSKKSNGAVKGWPRVERTRGHFVIVQMKGKNLDHGPDSRRGLMAALQKGLESFKSEGRRILT